MVGVFDRIYSENEWGGQGCGPGSKFEATALLRRILPELVRGVVAHSVLDAACGDGAWMPELPGYVGMDIVPAAIDAARKNHPDRTYLLGDIRRDWLPLVDMVICRDAMMHMHLKNGLETLDHLQGTGATWLVATTFENGVNEPIETGGFYHINLEAEPFRLGRPWMVIEDDWRHPDKLLGVWAMA